MFEYITGNITELNPTQATIETVGIGFAVNITLTTFSALEGKQNAKLYLYEAVREDAFTLYGFASKEERQMFLLLISVSGVGANTARMILSSVSTSELRDAVIAGDEHILKGIKGIGLKTAQRIIVDLRDKVAGVITTSSNTSASSISSSIADEATQALIMLGFSPATVKKGVQKIVSDDSSLTVEQIIKQALKLM